MVGSDVQLHAKGLLVYCWGNDNNDASKRESLKEMGVDAIIADSFMLRICWILSLVLSGEQ